jgi:hypothetical protein
MLLPRATHGVFFTAIASCTIAFLYCSEAVAQVDQSVRREAMGDGSDFSIFNILAIVVMFVASVALGGFVLESYHNFKTRNDKRQTYSGYGIGTYLLIGFLILCLGAFVSGKLVRGIFG